MDKIAIIGCGNMGEAILKGLLEKGNFKRQQIRVAEIRSKRRKYINQRYSVSTFADNKRTVEGADIIIFALKPQDMGASLEGLAEELKNKLLISIAAGINCKYIREKTDAKRIMRAMPNTPAIVGLGITALSAAKGTSASDKKIAAKIFSSVGAVIEIDERYMNAITALTGSGPAYFYFLMEAMIEAAGALGIRKDIASLLVTQTAYGAAQLQQITKEDPFNLRRKVASKGGTTEAALKVFKNKSLKKIVAEAIKAAASRAKELSR